MCFKNRLVFSARLYKYGGGRSSLADKADGKRAIAIGNFFSTSYYVKGFHEIVCQKDCLQTHAEWRKEKQALKEGLK